MHNAHATRHINLVGTSQHLVARRQRAPLTVCSDTAAACRQGLIPREPVPVRVEQDGLGAFPTHGEPVLVQDQQLWHLGDVEGLAYSLEPAEVPAWHRQPRHFYEASLGGGEQRAEGGGRGGKRAGFRVVGQSRSVTGAGVSGFRATVGLE